MEEDYYAWLLMIKKNKIMRRIMEIRMKEINSSSNSNNNGDIKKDVVEEVVPVEEAEKS